MFAELRSATRGLRRWRGAAVAIVTLTVGIGATTSLYALARVLVADMPGVPELDRVGRIYAASPALGVERAPVALQEFDSLLSRSTSFAAIGAYAAADAMAGREPDARAIVAGYASPGFFKAMGVAPIEGRVFSSADLAGAEPLVIVSDRFWRREVTGGRLAGARVTIDGVERAVIGVMPPEFSYPFVGITADVWLPLGPVSANAPAIVTVYGRLRPGATWPQAAAELDSMARTPWTWRAIPIESDTRTRAIGAYGTTVGPAVLVLLIACVNVACLLLARGLERDRELSVRRALGASRARVVRLLVGEHLLLAAIGGTLGAGLAALMLRAIAATASAVEPALASRLVVDAGLLPVALLTAGAACVVFGLIPAVRVARRDFVASLNGRPAAHRVQVAGYGARDLIVFGEVAAAAGLMVWVAMLFTLFAQLRSVHVAFPAERIVAMRVPAADARAVAARVQAVPGVSRVALSSGMLGGGDRMRVATPDGRTIVLGRVPVGAGFLETLGVPMLRGRSFDAADTDAGTGVVILSETAARHVAPRGDAIGMRLRTVTPDPRDLVVIGICRDAVDHGALTSAGVVNAEVYVPMDPAVPRTVVLARVEADAHGALRAIGAAAATRPGTLPVRPVVLSDEFTGRNRDASAVLVKILGAFALLTLALAASGVFAVITQSVTQRTREFGIRLAIGASPHGVLGMVLAREAKLIGFGIATGLAFALGLTHALFTELTQLTAALPWFSAGALALSAAVAALACALATFRIVRLEPAMLLRRN
jgi:predicted permease